MSAWFDPKSSHFVGIGWTGKSAKGISVDEAQGSAGRVLYIIKEHRKALRLIRQGLPKGSTGPHSKNIAKWVKKKDLEYQGEDNLSPEEEQKNIAYRVMSHVRKHGMSDWWAQNVPAAEGHHFFNYPQYYKDNFSKQQAESVMSRLSEGGELTGFKALINEVTLGVLSSARIDTSGEKVTVGFTTLGRKSRQGGMDAHKKAWTNADFAFLSDQSDFYNRWEKLMAKDDSTFNYIESKRTKIQAKISRWKKERSRKK
jgi:hypothetical protein